MTFNISEFIRVNRVYFIWAVFMGLLYLFRDMFGLVFITFIMCFIVSGIMHRLRRKYRFNRRVVVVVSYLLFLMGVGAFLIYIPPKLLAETINFTEQLPQSMTSVRNWLNSNLSQNELIAPLLPQLKETVLPESMLVSAWNILRGMLEKGLHYIGWFFTINGLAVVFLQYHASLLMKRIRLTTSMLIGCVLYALGYGSVGFFGSFTPIAFGVLLAAMGELIVSPGEQTLTSNIASPQTRGRYLGMIMVFYNMGSSLGFFAAGWLGQYVAPVYLPGPWLIIGAVAVTAGLGFYALRRNLTDEEDGKFTAPVPIKKDTVTLH